MSAPEVHTLPFKLAYLIAYKYANRVTRLAYPAQTTLANDLGMWSAPSSGCSTLERYGLVIAPGDGRTKSSRYWIDPERVTRVTPFSAKKGDKKGRQQSPKKGDTGVAQTKKRTNIGDQKPFGLSDPPEREIALTREFQFH